MNLMSRPGVTLLLFVFLTILGVNGQSGVSTDSANSAVQVIDGQMFGPGLRFSANFADDRLIIVDSPQPNTPSNGRESCVMRLIEGNIPIAIELSGDGVLPLDASLPGSTNPTGLKSLNIFLSSLPSQQNMTISPEGLLTQEPGSTVKHFNFQVSNYSCLQEGTYNVIALQFLKFDRRYHSMRHFV